MVMGYLCMCTIVCVHMSVCGVFGIYIVFECSSSFQVPTFMLRLQQRTLPSLTPVPMATPTLQHCYWTTGQIWYGLDCVTIS